MTRKSRLFTGTVEHLVFLKQNTTDLYWKISIMWYGSHEEWPRGTSSKQIILFMVFQKSVPSSLFTLRNVVEQLTIPLGFATHFFWYRTEIFIWGASSLSLSAIRLTEWEGEEGGLCRGDAELEEDRNMTRDRFISWCWCFSASYHNIWRLTVVN